MITLAHPWLLLFLPLPVVVVWLLPAHREAQRSVRIPFLDRLTRIAGQEPSSGAVVVRRSVPQWLLLVVLWGLAVVVVARPQLVGEPITKIIPSRDLLLAVDLSGSMDTQDFTDANGTQVDRLTAVKQVLDDFLTRREGDRVGLVFFGSAAFVQAPFTEDLDLCRTLLDEAQVGMAGPQTVIGDAVGLALTVFDRSEQKDRVLIVLTDGNDTGSKVPPDRAAEIAKDKGVTIYTVAVGDPEAVGEAKIDEEVLQRMASATGGDFYRANDRDELTEIYTRLDQLDTQELETQSYRPRTDLFQWPLAVYLLIGLGYHGFLVVRHAFRDGRTLHALPATAAAIALLAAGAAEATPDLNVPTGFHFLRPLWLLGLLPAGLVVRAIIARQDASQRWRGVIAANLLGHLLVKPRSAERFRPVHLLAVTWCLSVLALAGPTWRRERSPFANDEAAVVFAVEVSPTMLAQDIQPSRLERSVHKIRDLLALRPGADSALVAYAGSAHLVMPMTADADIVEAFASELTPQIMPLEGDSTAEAVALANAQLVSAGRPGSIVLITDGIDSVQNEELAKQRDAPVHILAVAGDQTKPLPLSSPPAPAINNEALEQSAQAAGATLTLVSPDDRDVQRLSRNITTSFVAAQQNEGGERWMDMGYWISPLIAFCTLVWFRPGWVVKWD